MKKLFTYLFVVCISASVASADFLSELDGFEDDTPGSAPAGTGWSSTGVSVSNSNAHTGNNAAYFTTDSAATNTISVNSPTKAWTDFRIRPALGAEPHSTPTNSATALFFFGSNGYVNVWNDGSWTVCSNNVWDAEVDAVSNAYVWISIYQNFSNKEYALFLNDELLIQDVPFVKTNLTAYNSFVVQNVDSNAYLDNVWIKSSYASGHSMDKNDRAGNDVEEVDTYGYAGRTLYVGGSGTPNYTTISAAVADARNNDEINVATGDYSSEQVVVSPTTELTNLVFVGNCFTVDTFTVSSGVTVKFKACIAAATITANDNITLVDGADLSATTLLDLKGNATVTGTDGSELSVANLDMASGTTVDVASGTFSETTASLSMDGTFTINGADWNTWNGSGIVAQSLPTSDDFEGYVNNTAITNYGLYGWGASSADVKVQSTVALGGSGKALILPDGTAASNKIDSATGAIWTEYYLRPMLGAQPSSSNTTGKSFMSYVDTNGFMVVYTDGDWETCDTNLKGETPAKLTTNNFKRVVIYQDFSSSKFALFVDNGGSLELVAQKKGFPGTQSSLNHFVISNNDNTAYLDSMVISTTAPSGSADLDDDGKSDVEEISLNGSTFIYPDGLGTIFRFI